MDTSGIPLGERAQRAILDHVIAVGDEAETNYIEVKSSLDLAAPEGVAKVAKFLLGSANRLPREASRHFQGYAVLVIGAQRGHANGIARGVEPHELEDRLRPYLGTNFPAFEFGRIGIDADREVVFVIAPPPQDGQSIFPCHKNYQGGKRNDNLDDGAIYIRGQSNTRPAKAGEVLALVERARSMPKQPISLDVQILGPISRIDRVSEILERLYHFEEERFIKAKPAEPEPFPSPLRATSSIFGRPAPLTGQQRAEHLEAWKRAQASNIQESRIYFLGVVLEGVGLQLTSRDRFISKPQVTVTFHNCEAFDHRAPNDADYRKVVVPVFKSEPGINALLDPSIYRSIAHRDYPVSWTNRDNNFEVTLTPESLRPNVPWRTDQDDYVVASRDPQAASVHVTWTLTEEGNDATTEGELEVATGPMLKAAELFKSSFLASNTDATVPS